MAKAKKKVAKKVVAKAVKAEEITAKEAKEAEEIKVEGLHMVLKNFTLGSLLYKKDEVIEVSKEDAEKLLKLELVKEL